MSDSFFEKLGKSLKLEDEQYDETSSPDDVSKKPMQEKKYESNEAPEDTDSLAEAEEVESAEEEYAEDVQEEEKPSANLAVARVAQKPKIQTRKKTARKTAPKASDEDYVEEGRLTIDVFETDDAIVIKSTIAGVNPEDLDINITSDSVSIRGERHQEEEISSDDYFYQECYWGAFSRSVILPTEVDSDKSEATIKNGVLTIRLPKLSKSQQKKLQVKTVS